MPLISVVTPVYLSCSVLEELHVRLTNTLSRITEDFEILMVNDGSPDDAWSVIRELAARDSRLKAMNLSRNFGQHAALTAGLDNARGDWIVVMDCDLQDQPEEILKLYQKAQEGFDVVFGRRYRRQDSFLKKLGSRAFYAVYNYFTDSDFDSSIANFSIARKSVIKSVLELRERTRSFPLFVKWVGYRIGYADVEHAGRKEGRSAYTLRKLIKFATENIISQSNKPLRLMISLGLLFSILSFFCGIYFLIKKVVLGVPIQGWTSLMVSLFFVGGLILCNLGIIGLYLGKVYDEVKKRPLYLVRDRLNLE